jgi:hypothetical protein
VAVYGDMESAEHAKTRVLVYIDKLVCRTVLFFPKTSTDSLYSSDV